MNQTAEQNEFESFRRLLDQARAEDLGSGDITCSIIPPPEFPISERLPCVIRRSITAVRMLRSAALFVGSTSGSNKNRKIASPFAP